MGIVFCSVRDDRDWGSGSSTTIIRNREPTTVNFIFTLSSSDAIALAGELSRTFPNYSLSDTIIGLLHIFRIPGNKIIMVVGKSSINNEDLTYLYRVVDTNNYLLRRVVLVKYVGSENDREDNTFISNVGRRIGAEEAICLYHDRANGGVDQIFDCARRTF
jgi:hypothetical protein